MTTSPSVGRAPATHRRAAELVAALGLEPHPEGGHFREVHRAPLGVKPADGRRERSALTVIYFLLAAGEVSRWHRVRSDEAWAWLEGDPLELHRLDAALERASTVLLGPYREGAEPIRVVPAGTWQAARSTGAFTLVSCAVGPGFDFEDFEMLADSPEGREVLREGNPGLAAFL